MTEKKLKKSLHRIWFHYNRLQIALNQAHHNEIISYEDHKTEAPCESMYELKTRIENTTRNTIARTFHSEIRSKV